MYAKMMNGITSEQVGDSSLLCGYKKMFNETSLCQNAFACGNIAAPFV